ncbi:MAG: hypothetical protein ACI935_002981 [Moritella dasanensis]|jgi:hypothetical protein
MWLNDKQVINSAISAYQESLFSSRPNHIVIDNLFNETKLNDVIRVLQQRMAGKLKDILTLLYTSIILSGKKPATINALFSEMFGNVMPLAPIPTAPPTAILISLMNFFIFT